VKQSIVTGWHIFTEIDKCQKELDELNQALDEIERGTLPYRLLEENRKHKQRELTELKNREYSA
jgi:hypothetical protein